jgi:Polysaccharide deacetylase
MEGGPSLCRGPGPTCGAHVRRLESRRHAFAGRIQKERAVRGYGTVQVDIDGWWAYCAAYGEASSREADPVYQEALPRLRATFDRHGIRATLFVVGTDMEVPAKRRLIEAMAREGHEIANHTFSHPLGLPTLPAARLAAEIDQAEDVLGEVAGARPVGFRAPGYAMDETVYRLLEERGYRYDSSLLPTFWGGVIRAVQARGARSGRAASPTCFGRPAHGLAPLRPYRPSRRRLWRPGRESEETGAVLEVPVTTMPFVRLPFHSTYVFSLGAGMFRLGRLGCRLTGAPINYVFHAIDLIGDEEGAPMLRRLGIRAPLARRQRLCDMILTSLKRSAQMLPTRDWLQFLTSAAPADAAADTHRGRSDPRPGLTGGDQARGRAR